MPRCCARWHPTGSTPGALAADPEAAGDYPGSVGYRIRSIADDPDLPALETGAPAPAFVVIADACLPGRRAFQDGRPVALHRVDHLIRAPALDRSPRRS